MPMNFPDLESLQEAAVVWKFRAPNVGETEQQYRNALADHVEPKDLVESCEIRNKDALERISKMTPSELRDFIAKQCNFPVPVAAGETLPKSINDWLNQTTVEIKQNDDNSTTTEAESKRK